MAIVKTILKLTERDVVVKLAGTAGTSTIAIATDIKKTNEIISGPIHTPISGVQWTGSVDGLATIVRNGVTIMTLNAGAAGALEMNGQMMIPDTIEDSSDIVVTFTGTAMEVWFRIKKTSGYKSAIETSEFGQYDNPAVVGE